MAPLITEKLISKKIDFNELHHKLIFGNISQTRYANKALVSYNSQLLVQDDSVMTSINSL